MLTMRPRRAFIMPRITALQLRKTLVRLVSRIACQSSSFIRISRLSRVMPALLTRIESGPNSLPTSPTSASMASPSASSSPRPWPLPIAGRRWPRASAPAWLVAVPTTVAPCSASRSAIAAPMPRLAPVTSAISPFRGWVIAADSSGRSVLPSGQGGVELFRRAERARLQRTVDALRQAGQDLARAALRDPDGTARGQRLHASRPLHREVQLAHQRVADRVRTLVHLAVHVLHHRQLRFAPFDFAHGSS